LDININNFTGTSLSGTNYAIIKDSSIHPSSNIQIQGNSTLIIDNSTISSTIDMIVKDNSSLIIKNSNITFQHIRIEDNAYLFIHSSLIHVTNINWGGEYTNVSFSSFYIRRSNGQTGSSGSSPSSGGSPDNLFFINNASEVVYLFSDFFITGGDGGTGGASTSTSTIGGTGGDGSSIFFICNSTNLTDISNDYNLKTGSGGEGGRGAPGGVGGKSGFLLWKYIIRNVSLIENSSYNIEIGDGGDGYDGTSNTWKHGGRGGRSGYIYFELNATNNIVDNSGIRIRGGNGGDGGNGYPHPAVNGFDYQGGNGGLGGYADDFISYINGTKIDIISAEIDFRLGSMGGTGGIGGTSNHNDGGHGGSGGSAGKSMLFFHSDNIHFEKSSIILGGIDGGFGGQGGFGGYGENDYENGGNGGNGGSSLNCSITINSENVSLVNSRLETDGPSGGNGGSGGPGDRRGGNGGSGGDIDNTCILIYCNNLTSTNSVIHNEGDNAGEGGEGSDAWGTANVDGGHGSHGGDSGFSILEILTNQILSSRNEYYNEGASGGSGGDGGHGDDDGEGGNGADSGSGGAASLHWRADIVYSEMDTLTVIGGRSKDGGDGGAGDYDDGGNGGYGNIGGYAKLKFDIKSIIINNQTAIVQAGESGKGGDGGRSDRSSDYNAQNAGLARTGGLGSNSIITITGINLSLNNLNYSSIGGLGGGGGNGGNGDPPSYGRGGMSGGNGIIKIESSNCSIYDNTFKAVGGKGGKGGNGANAVHGSSGTSGSVGGKGGNGQFEINITNMLNNDNNMMLSFGGTGGRGGSGGENIIGASGGSGGNSYLYIVKNQTLLLNQMVINSTGGCGGEGGQGDQSSSGGKGGDGGNSYYSITSNKLIFNGCNAILNKGIGGSPGVSEINSNYGDVGDYGTRDFDYYIYNLSSTNSTFNHELTIKYGISFLINTTSSSISVSSGSELREYYWIKFIMENEYDLPIPDALVSIIDNSSKVICENSETDNGVFEIALLNKRVWNTTSASYLYKVNSKVSVDNEYHHSAEKTVSADSNKIIKMSFFKLYPDLYVKNISINNSIYSAHQKVNISIVIGNKGDISCLESEVQIMEISNDPQIIYNGKIYNIFRKNSNTLNVTWIPRSEKNLIKVTIDPNNKIFEKNEYNNLLEAGPRIVLGKIIVNSSAILQGDLVEVNINITNNGKLFLPNSIMTVSIENHLYLVHYSNHSLTDNSLFSFDLNTSELSGWIQLSIYFDPLDIYFKVNDPIDADMYLYIDKDTDGDGIPDLNDNDIDNDGYNNSDDEFPEDATEWLDTDKDGIGNNADKDDDNDGYHDEVDSFPLDPNEWIDTDDDGIGDNADKDDDNDGVLDINDFYPKNPLLWKDPNGDMIRNISNDIEKLNQTLETIMTLLHSIDSDLNDIDNDLFYINGTISWMNNSLDHKINGLLLEVNKIQLEISRNYINLNKTLVSLLNGMNTTLRQIIFQQMYLINKNLLSINNSLQLSLEDIYSNINSRLISMNISNHNDIYSLISIIDQVNLSLGDKIDFDFKDLEKKLLLMIDEQLNETISMNQSINSNIQSFNESLHNKIEFEIDNLDNAVDLYLSNLQNTLMISLKNLNNTFHNDYISILDIIENSIDTILLTLEILNETIDYRISELILLQEELSNKTYEMLNEIIYDLEDFNKENKNGQEVLQRDIHNIQKHLNSTDTDLASIQEDILIANIHLLTYVNNETVFDFINGTIFNLTKLKLIELELINRTDSIHGLYDLIDDLKNSTKVVNELHNNIKITKMNQESIRKNNSLIIVTIVIESISLIVFFGVLVILIRKENLKISLDLFCSFFSV